MNAAVDYLRVPPHAVDAEQSVLGALMLDSGSLAKVSDWLSEDDFYRPDHRAIFRAVSVLVGRGDPIDPVTLGDWFEANGLSEIVPPHYLIEVTNATASSANVVAYAEIVVERARKRRLIDIGARISDAGYDAGSDAQQVLAETMHELSQMQTSKIRGALEPAKFAVQKLFTTIQERYEKGPQLLGHPWPWKDLNQVTNGMRDRTLYIVGARPSMGKSVFGIQVAAFNALRGNRTAFFSVEMGAEECMARAAACMGDIPLTWVEQPSDSDPDAGIYWGRLERVMERLRDAPLLIDETPALSVRQMLARARRAHLQAPLRLIVVDHMHDMEIDAKNARFDYGVITQASKSMAKEFGCPVILLAQLNRQAANRTDKRPTMTDLRESGEIEQKADVILFLHRPDYYDKGDMAGVLEVIPAKGRNIRVKNTIYLQHDFSRMRALDWIGELPARAEGASTKKGMK
jgi:replicative DNA helicase